VAAEPSRPDPRLRIIVPVLDEEQALPGLLDELGALHLVDQTLFVDNGSGDRSRAIISAAGARLVDEPRRGYGYPCATGAAQATAEGAAVLVFMEGDGSDDPADVERLARPVLDGTADLVIGSRHEAVRAGGGMPLHQRAGNVLFRLVAAALYGLRIADNGPFRAVSAGLLRRLQMEQRPFAWPTEMTLKAQRSGARIAVVETAYRPRPGSSKIAGTVRGTLGAFSGIFGTALRLRFSRTPRGPRSGTGGRPQ